MPDTPLSPSAVATACSRAHESRRPAAWRICEDALAQSFDELWRDSLPEPSLITSSRWLLHGLRVPGLYNYLVARARWIDDLLRRELGDGVAQVVLLGAGFDTRAHRIGAAFDRAIFFEVDRAATQDVKRRLLAASAQPLHPVRYIAADLRRDDLVARLAEAGFDRATRTLFIWEGVSYYLPPAAVDDTLRAIAASARDAAVVFDVVGRPVVEGACRRREGRAWRQSAALQGETLRFGLDDGDLEPFLRARGFQVVDRAARGDLRRAYFGGWRRLRRLTPLFTLLHARAAAPA